ncbi:MAG: RNA polymerase sigma factor [Acidimicrobiales bacterium]
MDNNDRAGVLRQLAFAAPSSAAALGALLQLIEDHHLARRTIRLVLVDNTEVDDAHQDVLIAIARSIGTYRGDAAFTTWLNTIARNTAIDHLRRRRDTNSLDQTPETFDTTARRLSSLIATNTDLHAAINQLPDHYREAVRLRDIDGHTYHHIAQLLDIKIDTVKSRISRGRALLAATLTAADLDQPGTPAS